MWYNEPIAVERGFVTRAEAVTRTLTTFGAAERVIRGLADALYRRVDWQWAQHGEATVTMGWTPEKGFWPNRWLGINQGSLVIMTENYRTSLIWQLMCRCPYVVRGLQRAGFRGGWLPIVAQTEVASC